MKEKFLYLKVFILLIFPGFLAGCSAFTSPKRTALINQASPLLSTETVSPVQAPVFTPTLPLSPNAPKTTPTFSSTQIPIPTETEPLPIPSRTSTITSRKSVCSSQLVERELPEGNLPESYKGKIFDSSTLPSGLVFIFGSLIDDSNYTLTEVIILENDTHLLWLSEMQCHNDYVYDELFLPEMKDNETLVVRYCRVDGQEDPEILAVGKFSPGIIPLTKIEHVWRANRETKKFEALSPEGIECWRDIGENSP
jgi:hypothetical protein